MSDVTGAAAAAGEREQTGARSAEAMAAIQRSCTRALNGHGDRSGADFLAMIPADVEIDHYGKGGVVPELEAEVASVLGKERALFVPSGTMAQQAALRVHADRRGRRAIVFHPACHLDAHEGRGYQRLHGLAGIPAGPVTEPLSLATLRAIGEPPAALVIELPQRDLGGVLPEWDDLVAQVGWAHERGAAAHLDGARLWEAAPYYHRTPTEVAALFDTVYVSLYKGLGGIGGCCVAGPADVVEEISEWRTRHGGRLYGMWPLAASGLTGLRARLPRMPAYYAHALAIAEALRDVPGLRVLPDPPQSPMMHLQISATAHDLERRVRTIAQRDRIWTFPHIFASDTPYLQRIEFSVGDATLGFRPDEVRALVVELAAP